jgi:hypothetical protein
MRCKRCKQEGSPIFEAVEGLKQVGSVEVLSACAGYMYPSHSNIPERPFILFSIYSWKQLENLWQKVFSRLGAPTAFVYNGARQFVFEIELPREWPNRDEMLRSIWTEISERIGRFEKG